MTEWDRQCVLCAARGRTTRLEAGHCCIPCASWLQVQVADIARLAADAAAWVAPGSSTGGGSRPVPGSRPPCRVDALDPENTPVPGHDATVLELCESWERMIRDMRGMAPYGPASAARARGGLYEGTTATLVASTAFLGRSVAWMVDAEFPLEDFADEMRDCVRVLRRWDHDAVDRGQMVPCPTMHEDEGTCNHRLYYRDWNEHVTCRKCGVSRDASTLVAVAMSDGRDVWLDPEAASRHYGVNERELRRWARSGKIESNHGRYLLGSIAKAVG
jgi:hypothetical protein